MTLRRFESPLPMWCEDWRCWYNRGKKLIVIVCRSVKWWCSRVDRFIIENPTVELERVEKWNSISLEGRVLFIGQLRWLRVPSRLRGVEVEWRGRLFTSFVYYSTEGRRQHRFVSPGKVLSLYGTDYFIPPLYFTIVLLLVYKAFPFYSNTPPFLERPRPWVKLFNLVKLPKPFRMYQPYGRFLDWVNLSVLRFLVPYSSSISLKLGGWNYPGESGVNPTYAFPVQIKLTFIVFTLILYHMGGI